MTIATFLILKFWIVLTVSCGYALWRGGAPERIAAAAMATAAISSAAVVILPASAWNRVQIGIFGSDVALLGVLTVLALKAERYWTLWMAAFQLVAVIVHLARFLDTGITGAVYSIVQSIWAYPMLGGLLLGTIRHRARIKRYGKDASWSTFSRP